jgi:hypothetical protein
MRQDAEVRVTACSRSTKATRSDAPCFPERPISKTDIAGMLELRRAGLMQTGLRRG